MNRRLLLFGLVTFFAAQPQKAASDPEVLHDDIQIRKLLNAAGGTMRIAKDPRDRTLYTLTAGGISPAF